MTIPLLTPELVTRLVESEADYLMARLTGLQSQLPDNPYEVQIQHFGKALAFSCATVQNPRFNQVIGLGETDLDQLSSILDWYAELGRHCEFDIVPLLSTEKVLQRLAKAGYYQSNFHTVLYTVPEVASFTSPTDVRIENVTITTLPLLADLYARGLEYPADKREEIIKRVALEYSGAGWQCAIAYHRGERAAMGNLYIRGKTASLAGATTLPQLRGHGCQTALLRYRLNQAAEAGCDLVVGQTELGAVSQHNMERIGLRVAYTKASWKLLES